MNEPGHMGAPSRIDSQRQHEPQAGIDSMHVGRRQRAHMLIEKALIQGDDLRDIGHTVSRPVAALGKSTFPGASARFRLLVRATAITVWS